ncbi:MAG TPA: FAD binding domain-containing protein [Chloroflexota bacterium]
MQDTIQIQTGEPGSVLLEMPPFRWLNPKTLAEAVAALNADKSAQVIGGGSDLLGILKDRIKGPAMVYPSTLVNMKSIADLAFIRDDADGLHIGSATTIADLESSQVVQSKVPALAQAAMSIASPQHRNVGTLGGNLHQRPRCWYFRAGGFGEGTFQCYKRGGDFCYAVTGENKYHAILGGELCYIVHPSDSATALTALKAEARIVGGSAERVVPFDNYWVGPRTNVLRENILEHNELLAEVRIPPLAAGARSVFLKFKERAVLDFAVSSVAAVVTLDAGGVVSDASVVLGGVAPIPYRATQAEAALKGKKLDATAARDAANAAVVGARPMTSNGYKVDLTRGLVEQALASLIA